MTKLSLEEKRRIANQCITLINDTDATIQDVLWIIYLLLVKALCRTQTKFGTSVAREELFKIHSGIEQRLYHQHQHIKDKNSEL